ncbi:MULTISPECIES: amino acid adenylation domain-containing protein [Streptomyces]|uniref:Amino acid adenylation domain-containing protein n=1 Tax=Streptomyces eurythermus TaxID=42237 RepID=A0ABW6Z965_9ACTN|nr:MULTISPECIES: amino acid adenylation domain-containing protein [Streptomyces]QIS68697.1 amino acid adenylation domain-containing protein [Streptomyces sp. DSM 40868]
MTAVATGLARPPAEWFDTARPWRRDVVVPELLAEAARRHGARPALVTAQGTAYTHAELFTASGRTAGLLRELGAGPGSFIGLLSDHHPEAVRGIIGALRAGAAYVPVDPRWPTDRMARVLNQVGCDRLLVDRSNLARAAELVSRIPTVQQLVCLDGPSTDVPGAHVWGTDAADASEPLSHAAVGCGPEDLAYVIFTSGSTGQPKGVMVRHRTIVNAFEWVNREFAVTESDRQLLVTSWAFDLSVHDTLGVLSAGGSVRIVPDDDLVNPGVLARILDTEEITCLTAGPAAISLILSSAGPRADGPVPSLRLVLTGGDWIPVSMPGALRERFPRAEVVSAGGATEATIWSNFYRIREVDPSWPSIPYGTPLQNSRYYVLDENYDHQPIGEPGDLYIGGECLSEGYFGDRALTAAKFLPDPHSPLAGGRMYHTGDRARWLTDGNLEFLGRRDDQVKVRGYRIELGDVQAALATHPAVSAAAVVAVDVAGERGLVGYYACRADAVVPGELRAHIAKLLPEYMIPSPLIPLQHIPMTANGKFDRVELARQAKQALHVHGPECGRFCVGE